MKNGLFLLTGSLVIHASIFAGVDRAVYFNEAHLLQQQKKVLREAQDKLQFEFVEAPLKVHPQAPKKTKKISNRDALNQDQMQDKSKADGAPQVKALGPSDQLAQKRGGGATQAPQPKVDPAKMQKAVEAEAERPSVIPAEAGIRPDPRLRGDDTAEKEAPVKMVEEKPKPLAKPQPLVNPKPPLQGTPGQDKITTQEMGRTQSQGAALFGITSFEATGSGMGEYMKNLKEKIWLAWFPYLAFQYPQDFRGADVVLSMTLNAEGEVKIVKIIASEGSPLFATYCVEAVQRASSFGPVPPEILALIGKDDFELKFGFHYR